ncbi:MAG TPA: hypothetical protein VNA25_18540 [Phycisphaerae bacterium]|nr:hypothetical protein [Phycisphaerae bacterium]
MILRQALQKLDPLWDELFPAEKERIVKLLVEEVMVNPDGLLIRLRLNGLNSLAAELAGDGPDEMAEEGRTADLRVPMEFKVRGGRKEIILPPDAESEPEPKAKRNQPLVLALARAHRWQRMIDSDDVGAFDKLAGTSWVGSVVRRPNPQARVSRAGHSRGPPGGTRADRAFLEEPGQQPAAAVGRTSQGAHAPVNCSSGRQNTH